MSIEARKASIVKTTLHDIRSARILNHTAIAEGNERAEAYYTAMINELHAKWCRMTFRPYGSPLPE